MEKLIKIELFENEIRLSKGKFKKFVTYKFGFPTDVVIQNTQIRPMELEGRLVLEYNIYNSVLKINENGYPILYIY